MNDYFFGNNYFKKDFLKSTALFFTYNQAAGSSRHHHHRRPHYLPPNPIPVLPNSFSPSTRYQSSTKTHPHPVPFRPDTHARNSKPRTKPHLCDSGSRLLRIGKHRILPSLLKFYTFFRTQ